MSDDGKIRIMESDLCCYKQFNTERPQYVAFNIADISSMEQKFVHLNADSIEVTQYVCLTLKHVSSAESMGHHHLEVEFHDLMLRWQSWVDSRA